jgi:hypothetical protein
LAEYREKKIEFPEEDPNTFAKALMWVHGTTLTYEDMRDDDKAAPNEEDKDNESDCGTHILGLAKVYCLAVKFQILDLANLCGECEKCHYEDHEVLTTEAIAFVYQHPVRDCPLRQWFVNSMVNLWHSPGHIRLDNFLVFSNKKWVKMVKSAEEEFLEEVVDRVREHQQVTEEKCKVPYCNQHRVVLPYGGR